VAGAERGVAALAHARGCSAGGVAVW
jgi:hypothetical protein